MSCTVPFTLDHNRMLIDGEIQRTDGSWRQARFWIDTGNPDFFISGPLARDLGLDLSDANEETQALEVAAPSGVRIGGLPLDFEGVHSMVMFRPRWLFTTMHIDANLPATVLMQHHVIFDYPRREFTLAAPGSPPMRGERVPAHVHPETGIVQIDATLEGDSLSFALDNGASYSFASGDWIASLLEQHPDWPSMTGAIGCANIWGWWPGEESWPVVRVPELQWGSVTLTRIGIAGLPRMFPGGLAVDTWYSQKSARPVDGFLGPNAFGAFRIEIDYAGEAVAFEKGEAIPANDLDLVGLTLRPQPDGGFAVLGTRGVEGIEPGDRLLRIGGLETTGATMGTVVDGLRGRPGELRRVVLERDGERIEVDAEVKRHL